MIITSPLPVSAWHDVIGNPTYADAILDRLVTTLIASICRAKACGESSRKKLDT
ncbi:ATP-binding protein [Mesorhizobium sp. M0520]|uniref:ATP-binding protein n=1 Tax=Mesorhizobium sp. M0520 TaxID=2956957 RepID=UPI0033379944